MSVLPCVRHDRRAHLFALARRATAAALVSLCALADAADLLSLPDAQRLAVARSRQIVAEDAAIDAERAMSVAARQLPDPVLKAGVDNLPVDGADRGSLSADFMTMRRIGISQEITRSDKRVLRSERYLREADRTFAEKDKVIATVERETAIAWLDRFYAEAMTPIIAAQRARAIDEQQAADAAYRSGRGSRADVLAAKEAVLQFDDRLDEAARRVRSATIELQRWVGDAASRQLVGQPVIDTIRLDPATLDTQLSHHPEVAVMARQEEVAAVDARLAQADKKPDWSVEVAFQQRGPAYSNMVSVGVSVPLQWDRTNRQDRALAAKLALVDQARAERDEVLRTHVAETRALIEAWRTNRVRLGRYARARIPLAEERSEAALTAYRGGKTTLADVLAARRNELDIRLAALQLEADTARLWAQLNFLFPASHGAAAAARDVQ